MLETYKCTKCNTTKQISDFPKNRTKKHGIDSRCKTCASNHVRAFYKSHTKHVLKYQEKYRSNNKKKISDMNKLYATNNKDAISAKKKEYREANKEEINRKQKIHRELYPEQMKKYRAENKEKLSESHKLWRAKNINKLRESNKAYSSSERGRLVDTNAKHKRRYIKKSKSDGTIPINVYPLSNELKKLLVRQEYKCNVCSKSLNDGKHLDHHVPLSKGGTHSIDNVVWLCPRCNMSKSNKMPTQLLLV